MPYDLLRPRWTLSPVKALLGPPSIRYPDLRVANSKIKQTRPSFKLRRYRYQTNGISRINATSDIQQAALTPGLGQ